MSKQLITADIQTVRIHNLSKVQMIKRIVILLKDFILR